MNTPPSEIWGESEAIIAAKNRLSRAAKVNRPVLIVGERGTGKELAAARLHFLSPRWNGPYLTLNCAALSPSLLESELFGYESGAFTGAGRTSPGRFEAADGGTLFLDEISHLSLTAQAKILRVVEYGSFQRLGSPRERQVDVRLVSATNVDLRARVRSGEFLPDLLDRLSFEIITLPPLRDREGDVLPLAHRFAARMAGELELPHIPTFSPEAAAALEAYAWPGNVRELKNTVERAVYREAAQVIEAADLELEDAPPAPLPGPASAALPAPGPAVGTRTDGPLRWPLAEGRFDELMAAYADSLFEEALARARHNQKEAARLLGLTYHRFRFLRKKYRPGE
ncbi:MAG: sigma 54-interacting transcriptional regulator [Candidatus Adiutrix sp.]|jgi:psp operon transcriptional activator|nr:sigma 54-interacting transcriptional regulator [Candidatus Adiutrix sp.]